MRPAGGGGEEGLVLWWCRRRGGGAVVRGSGAVSYGFVSDVSGGDIVG